MLATKMWRIFYAALGFGVLTGVLLYGLFYFGSDATLAYPGLGLLAAAVAGVAVGFGYYLFFKFTLRAFTRPFLQKAQVLVTRPIAPLRPPWSSNELDKLEEILNEALATLDRLDRFSEIAKEIVGALDQQRTLGRIVGTAVETLPADSGLVFLLDEKSGRYTVRISYLLPALDGQEDQVSFAAGEGVPGWVATEGDALLIAEAQQDERVHPLLRQAGVQALLSAPLSVGGRTIGVLNLFNRERSDAFDENDLRLACVYADLAAVALANARLFDLSQAQAAQAESLNQIARAVNANLDLETILGVVAEEVARLAPYVRLSLALPLEHDPDHLRVRPLVGRLRSELPDFRPTPIEGSGVGWAFVHKQPFVAPDLDQEQRFPLDAALRQAGVRSYVCLPLVQAGQPVGVLNLGSDQPRAYGDHNLPLLQRIGEQLAVALHNAQLYKEAEDERRKLAAILNDTDDMVIVLDEAERVLLLNPATEHCLHVLADEVAGQPLPTLGVDDLETALAAARNAQAPVVREIAIPGGRTLYASVSPVQDVGWVLVMQDITPLKELDQLRTEWVAAVSHDLKNPITTVQMAAMLLDKAGPLNEKQRELLDRLEHGSKQLRSLVTDVLDLARLEAGPVLKMRAVAPDDVVARALTEVEALAADKGVALSVELPPHLPPVRGDAALLTRVVVNLLSNGIKYTPAGGEVQVRARPQDGALLFEVRDTGYGIPAEALPYLFDRFYRVPDHEVEIEGSGLGLSIVKSIVEKHGGRVWVESQVGQGSTFAFTVPT